MRPPVNCSALTGAGSSCPLQEWCEHQCCAGRCQEWLRCFETFRESDDGQESLATSAIAAARADEREKHQNVLEQVKREHDQRVLQLQQEFKDELAHAERQHTKTQREMQMKHHTAMDQARDEKTKREAETDEKVVELRNQLTTEREENARMVAVQEQMRRAQEETQQKNDEQVAHLRSQLAAAWRDQAETTERLVQERIREEKARMTAVQEQLRRDQDESHRKNAELEKKLSASHDRLEEERATWQSHLESKVRQMEIDKGKQMKQERADYDQRQQLIEARHQETLKQEEKRCSRRIAEVQEESHRKNAEQEEKISTLQVRLEEQRTASESRWERKLRQLEDDKARELKQERDKSDQRHRQDELKQQETMTKLEAMKAQVDLLQKTQEESRRSDEEKRSRQEIYDAWIIRRGTPETQQQKTNAEDAANFLHDVQKLKSQASNEKGREAENLVERVLREERHFTVENVRTKGIGADFLVTFQNARGEVSCAVAIDVKIFSKSKWKQWADDFGNKKNKQGNVFDKKSGLTPETTVYPVVMNIHPDAQMPPPTQSQTVRLFGKDRLLRGFAGKTALQLLNAFLLEKNYEAKNTSCIEAHTSKNVAKIEHDFQMLDKSNLKQKAQLIAEEKVLKQRWDVWTEARKVIDSLLHEHGMQTLTEKAKESYAKLLKDLKSKGTYDLLDFKRPGDNYPKEGDLKGYADLKEQLLLCAPDTTTITTSIQSFQKAHHELLIQRLRIMQIAAKHEEEESEEPESAAAFVAGPSERFKREHSADPSEEDITAKRLRTA